ncbi:hypothetical protein [Proteiniclasticum ruminis]|uniref:Uncharacterized protein n=1 Tax=Proteiniclasticum ruminis TaxID=398199 RepID=A0A1I4ZJG0_9CLOT|nr:hypothetical protein [Proteiniclasticum ruminis]SFN50405.1 hypothetical protein SAMN04488695_10218 [Proteiniclasticum ruminis]
MNNVLYKVKEVKEFYLDPQTVTDINAYLEAKWIVLTFSVSRDIPIVVLGRTFDYTEETHEPKNINYFTSDPHARAVIRNKDMARLIKDIESLKADLHHATKSFRKSEETK